MNGALAFVPLLVLLAVACSTLAQESATSVAPSSADPRGGRDAGPTVAHSIPPDSAGCVVVETDGGRARYAVGDKWPGPPGKTCYCIPNGRDGNPWSMCLECSGCANCYGGPVDCPKGTIHLQ